METQPQINVQEVIKQMYQDQDLQNLWTRLRNRMAAMVPLGINKEGILFYSGGTNDLVKELHFQIAKLTKERYPLLLGTQLKERTEKDILEEMRIAYNMSPREWAEAYCDIRPHEDPNKLCQCKDPGFIKTSGGVTTHGAYTRDGVSHCWSCDGILPDSGEPPKVEISPNPRFSASYFNKIYDEMYPKVDPTKDPKDLIITSTPTGQLGKGRPTFDPMFIREDESTIIPKRYFRCTRCNARLYTTDGANPGNLVCTEPQDSRTSGICGGSFDVEITEEDYKNLGNHGRIRGPAPTKPTFIP